MKNGSPETASQAAWKLHLENLRLRANIRALAARIQLLERHVDFWRTRALNGRPPGRATRKHDKKGAL